MIAALRRAGVLPILIWLFAFPVVILAVVLGDQQKQRAVAVESVRAVDTGPVDIRWILTPRTRDGYVSKYQRAVCATTPTARYIVRLGKKRPTSEALLRRWTATDVERAPGAAAPSSYLQRC